MWWPWPPLCNYEAVTIKRFSLYNFGLRSAIMLLFFQLQNLYGKKYMIKFEGKIKAKRFW